MSKKPMVMQDNVFTNETDEPIEVMVPADMKARVSYDQRRFSYVVDSPKEAQESVVLYPEDQIELI